MFSATVALKRKGSSSTTAMAARSDGDVDVAHVGAVDEHRAGADVVQARDELDERRLARAGGADEGDRAARRHVEVDVVQGGPRRALVAQRHVAQLDVAGAGWQRRRVPGAETIPGSRSRIW